VPESLGEGARVGPWPDGPARVPIRGPTQDGERRRQKTPRGRNWMLIRGPTGRVVLGTACSQVR